jgi:photosystem II stability/assembly factor-like uncharacterized protein
MKPIPFALKAWIFLGWGLAFAAAAANPTWEKITPPHFHFADTRVVEEFSTGPGKEVYLTSLFTWGYYKSLDAGKTWKAYQPKFKTAKGAVMQRHMGRIAALPSGDLIACSNYSTKDFRELKGIFRSKDDGANWEAVVDSAGSAYGAPLISASSGGSTVALAPEGSRSSTLWISRDNGAHWKMTDRMKFITNLDVSAGDDIHLTATDGKALDQPHYQLHRSKDGGETWEGVFVNKYGPPISLAANLDGAYALGMSGGKFGAWAAPQDTAVVREARKDAGESHSVEACALSPDGRIVLGLTAQGIVFAHPGSDDLATLNDGLGEDALAPHYLHFDPAGNLYLHAGDNLYVMRGAVTALRAPEAIIRPKVKNRDWMRDLRGRWLEAKRPAAIWTGSLP